MLRVLVDFKLIFQMQPKNLDAHVSGTWFTGEIILHIWSLEKL